MPRRVLVTGAAGFMGSFLSEELVENGYFVAGVDNFFRGKRENLNHLLQDNRFIFEEMDLSLGANREKLRQFILAHKIDTLLHLAAINGTQYFYDKPLFVLGQNVLITQNVLAAVENTSVNYFIYTSSSEVYGDPLKIPTPETHPILLNAASDRDSYAASKAIGDFYIRLAAVHQGRRFLILRVFNQYGERMVGTRYGQVIAEFVRRMLFEKKFTILGDGRHTRSFCYIKDAAVAIRRLIEQEVSGILNLGCDEEISILELAKKIHLLENKPFHPIFLPERPQDHKQRRPDITALKALLPDLAFTSLETGLKKVIAYFKHGDDLRS